jgi:hypothetical protein
MRRQLDSIDMIPMPRMLPDEVSAIRTQVMALKDAYPKSSDFKPLRGGQLNALADDFLITLELASRTESAEQYAIQVRDLLAGLENIESVVNDTYEP